MLAGLRERGQAHGGRDLAHRAEHAIVGVALPAFDGVGVAVPGESYSKAPMSQRPLRRAPR